jgi:hypothetical protein
VTSSQSPISSYLATNSSAARAAHRARLARSPLALAIATTLALAAAGTASADTCQLTAGGGTLSTWAQGGTGTWFTGLWSGGTPNSATASTCIVDGTSTVTLDNNASVASLQVGSGNTLNVVGGDQLSVYGPQIINNGNINVAAGNGNNTYLNIAGNTTLSGDGLLMLSQVGGSGTSIIQQVNSNYTLTNQGSIIGTGVIGNSSGLTLTNIGTINANVNGQVLTINSNGGPLTNTGTLIATAGGTLQLTSQTIDNTGGNIYAVTTGSVVNLANTSVTGGTLTALSGGVLQTVGTATLNGVTISGDYLSDVGTQTYVSGTISHTGNLLINAGSGNNSYLNINGATTLTGGTTTLAWNGTSTGTAIIQQTNGNQTLVNDETIHGAGNIGNSSGLTVTNNGTINADVSGQTLALTLANSNNGGVFANNGTLEATNGGTLLFASQTVANAGRTITATGAGSALLLQNTIINGGALAVSGGGTMQTVNTATLNGVTLNGNYLSDLGTQTYVSGTISHTGNLQINAGSGNNTYLNINGATTLTGGTTTLAWNGTSTGSAFIQQTGGNQTLINDETIHGAGNIGNSSGLTVTNNGTINADVSGQTLALTLANSNNGGVFANNGTLEATNGGTLLFASQTVANAGRTITATGAGSALLLQNTIINGGALAVSGGGTMQTVNTATLNGVTLNGNYLSDLGTQTYVSGTISHTGNLQINAGSGNNTYLNINGATTLTGGTTTLAWNGTSTGSAIIQQTGGNQTLTNSDTIQGAGNIGNSGGLTLVNTASGVINANLSGQTLTLSTGNANDPLQQLQNHGVLEATNGATLLFASQNVANAGQTITAAGAGSALNLQNTTINGGTLAVSGGATMQTLNTATLNGVTLNGNYLSDVGTQTYVTGTISHTGNLLINAGNGNDTYLQINGTTTLTGGTTTLAWNGTSTGSAIIQQTGGNQTLINDETIHGTGNIGNSGGLTVTNNGTINADVTGQTLTISAGNSNNGGVFQNSGTVAATNGSALVFASQTVANGGQGIKADGAGTVVTLQNTTINGGTLAATNGALFQTGNAATLNGVTLSGNYLADVATQTTLTGAIANNGAIQVNAGSGNNTYVLINAPTTLAGSGTLTLAYNGTSTGAAIIQQSGANQTFTNGSTIQGAGVIGNTTGLTLINAAGGTINANVANQTLTINGTNANDTQGAVANSGTLLASAGTLAITPAVYGTGTLQTTGTGVVDISAARASSSVGNLINNSTTTGAGLVLGGNSITVSSDYQNASFGVGNTFNKLGNVSTTGGQILAAGNVATAITGTNVANGTSGTATLTIGNVHVGANSYDFQVANTGTTGPALRGAIQTNVNGAAISDGNLSVAAQNFGPIAAGGSSGPVAVTYTASTAGALGALSGTNTLHIANNFQNVAEQNLDIVVGSGAAAYNLANGSAANVTVANQRIGGSTLGSVAVTNTAPSGAYTEALNASFTGSTGNVTSTSGAITGGSGSGVAGGATNSSALTVGIDTTSSGAKTGTVTLQYASNGTGSSGLGTTTLNTQTVNVTGNVYQAAAGAIVTAPLNFGVVQVGQTVTQNLVVQNTATGASGFVEDLNAAFGSSTSGLLSGSGTINGVRAGQSSTGSNGTMTVAVNTGSAGTISGSINVNFITAGAVNGVSDGLGTASVGSAPYGVSGTVQTTGTVINDASPLINNSPISLGNVRVGATSPTGFVSITNQATTAPQAALDVTSITGNAPITASGTINLLGPGSTDTSSLKVGMNTATAGAVNGTATLALVSDASNAGCTSNCQLSLGTQNVNVTGGVYNAAQPAIAGTVNLGNVHVSGTASGTIGISNTNVSPAGFQEGLDVAVNGTSGATATGSLSNLAAGNSGTIATSLAVGSAGVQSGTVTLGLASNGSTTSGLATLSLGTQTVTVQATGYNLAAGSTADVVVGAQRVGGANTAGLAVMNTAAAGSYTEVLNAGIAGTSGQVANATGSIAGGLGSGVAGGATNSSAITVGVDTTSSGAKTGTVSLQYASNGTGTSNLGTTTLGTQVVNVSGNVYQTAIASVAPTAINFGIVHVGDTVSTSGVTVTNAASGALVDVLTGGFSGVTGPFTATGSLTGIAAGSNSGTALQVGLNTATAGTFSGSAQLGLSSHDGELADVAAQYAGVSSVALTGQVNYHATPTFELSSGTGTLTENGTAFTLNLGNVAAGTSITDLIEFLNGAPGQSDALAGSFADAGLAGLSLTGFDAFSGYLDGQGLTGTADFTAGTTTGVFTDVLTFSGTGSNDNGAFSEDLGATLTITGDVTSGTTNVPEPDSLLLAVLGLGLIGAAQWRRSARAGARA